MPHKDPESEKLYKQRYYLQHKDEIKGKQAEYRSTHREDLAERNRQYYQNNKEVLLRKSSVRSRTWEQKIKREVLLHYTQALIPDVTEPLCVKCGFLDIRALTIDHINDDGAKHRKEILGVRAHSGGGGRHFYRWLQENEYPEGFQTLCFNCQWIKRLSYIPIKS